MSRDFPYSPEQPSGKQRWLGDPSQTLCVLGNHRVWYSQRREGPCGRNRRAGACPSQGPDTPPLRPPHPSPLIHSLCAPPPPLTVCAPTCPSQTAPSEEFTRSLPPLLFYFLFFFIYSVPFLFLYHSYLAPQAFLLPHAPLYAALMPHKRPECSLV